MGRGCDVGRGQARLRSSTLAPESYFYLGTYPGTCLTLVLPKPKALNPTLHLAATTACLPQTEARRRIMAVPPPWWMMSWGSALAATACAPCPCVAHGPGIRLNLHLLLPARSSRTVPSGRYWLPCLPAFSTSAHTTAHSSHITPHTISYTSHTTSHTCHTTSHTCHSRSSKGHDAHLVAAAHGISAFQRQSLMELKAEVGVGLGWDWGGTGV